MSDSQKQMSERDFQQTLKFSFNEEDKSLATAGFLVGKVGRKITVDISTTSVSNDTISYAFSENGTPLYTYTCIYTDGSRTQLLSAERTA